MSGGHNRGFADLPGTRDMSGVFSAHDFVWKQLREPYDLVVYQLGNAACHDYMGRITSRPAYRASLAANTPRSAV